MAICVLLLSVSLPADTYGDDVYTAMLENLNSNITTIQNNTLISQLGIRPKLNNENLISCLIKYESNGNNDAIGSMGEIGVLQFLPSTFVFQCIKIYKLTESVDSIKNIDIQKICADKMISDGKATQWSTYNRCLN